MSLESTTICSHCDFQLPPSASYYEQLRQIASLRGNSVLSDAETQNVSSLLQDAQAELSVHDREIRLLESSLSQLRERRNNLRAHIHRCQGMVQTSFSHVPAEVLSEILLLAKEPKLLVDGEFECLGGFQDRMPLRLSHVCSRWRSVALDTPALWSHIQLRAGVQNALEESYACYSLKEMEMLTKLYIERSKKSLLTVDIDYPAGHTLGPYPSPHEEYLWSIIRMICDEGDRWYSATLSFETHNFSMLALPTVLPVIEDLSLESHGNPEQTLVLPSISLPRLRNLYVYGERPIDFHASNLDIGSIPHIVINSWPISAVLKLFAQAISAQTVGLQDIGGFVEPPTPWPVPFVTVNTSVRELYLTCPSFAFLNILRNLTLPNLTRLDISRPSIVSIYGTLHTDVLSDFLFRCGSETRLKELYLYRAQTDAEKLLPLLEMLPALTYLGLEGDEYFLSSKLFSGLILDSTVNPLPRLPLLTRLEVTIEGPGAPHRVPFVVSAVISRRWHLESDAPAFSCPGGNPIAVSRLQWVRLTIEGQQHARARFHEDVKTLRKEGLDFKVKEGFKPAPVEYYKSSTGYE